MPLLPGTAQIYQRIYNLVISISIQYVFTVNIYTGNDTYDLLDDGAVVNRNTEDIDGNPRLLQFGGYNPPVDRGGCLTHFVSRSSILRSRHESCSKL